MSHLPESSSENGKDSTVELFLTSGLTSEIITLLSTEIVNFSVSTKKISLLKHRNL